MRMSRRNSLSYTHAMNVPLKRSPLSLALCVKERCLEAVDADNA